MSGEDIHEAQEVDAKIIDGADKTFVPYMINMLKNVMRLDVVWDRYLENTLKICIRQKRGTGVRRKVTENAILPSNWQTFLGCESLQDLCIEQKP